MKRRIILYLLLAFSNNLHAQSIGTKVTFPAVDGKTYTGVISQIQGYKYKIKYDGFNFESWLTRQQFTVVKTPGLVTAPSQQTQSKSTINDDVHDIYTIYNYGKVKGWASIIQE